MAADLTGATLLYRADARRNFPIPEKPDVRLGFERSNDIPIRFPGVSRHHARILSDGKSFWIEDAGSSNGTFLNGRQVRRRERLEHLDVVTLGRKIDLIFLRRRVEQRRVTRGIRAAFLEVLDGVEGGTRREIPRGSITIGRAQSNNVVADSQAVSKVHARLERSSLQLMLVDLNSSNGTFVDGKRISSQTLEDGNEFSLGGARRFRVHLDEGDVETNDIGSATHLGARTNPSLPMDWKTRIEWTTEERAVWDAVRSGRYVPGTLKQDAVASPAVPPPPASPPKPPNAPVPERVAPPAPSPPKPMPAPLQRLILQGKEQTFSLTIGDHEVGRVPSAQVHIDSPSVSRRHAVLRVRETEAVIEDLGSQNGTLVNTARLQGPYALREGDVVYFGNMAFRVRFEPPTPKR